MSSPHRPNEWDDEPIGDYDTGIRRTWRRPWNNYLALLLGFLGAIVLIGSFSAPGVPPKVGGILALLSPIAVVRSDGPRPKAGQPPPPPPSMPQEVGWLVVAVLLVVVGLVLLVV
jgi:hypothetical protein